MPKNKLSMQYLDNLILCRGPVHEFKQFPQFAPDKRKYSLLPQVDFLDMIKNDKDITIVSESSPGQAKSTFYMI
jgi:hypothetical protein